MCKKINKKMNSYKNRDKRYKASMKRAECNAFIYASTMQDDDGTYGIYLDYAGRSRFLVNRKDKLLFKTLQPGMSLGELRRWRPWRGPKAAKMEKRLSHVLNVADFELEQILEYEAESHCDMTTSVHPLKVQVAYASGHDVLEAA